ncbi:MAG: hypothetical protein DRI34_03150 [Deltaproteobacteria bacterium]|nr:MAG: hypothetical protein DRI34_03150 [Deltaproteobacteria bacterium]
MDSLTGGWQAIEQLLARHDLVLVRPSGLWLLAALPLVWLLARQLRRGGWSRWRRLALVTIRSLLVVALALALGEPQRLQRRQSPALGVVGDWSQSVGPAGRRRLLRFARRTWAGGASGRQVIVAAGQRPRLVAGPRGGSPERLEGLEAAGHSDLAAALYLAAAHLPAGARRQLVLLSDGGQTRGDAVAAAAALQRAGITVHAVYLPPLRDGARLEQLEVPATVAAGDDFTAAAVYSCPAGRPARLAWRADGRRLQRRRARCGRQPTRAEISTSLGEPGWHLLCARLEQPEDAVPANNRSCRRVFVRARPRVLLVSRDPGANPLARILEAARWRLQRLPPQRLPTDPAAIAGYQLLVLDDIELGALDARQARALSWFVSSGGGGLLVAAGRAALPLAGPEQLPIEPLLPVEFKPIKKKEKIPAAVVFVLDRSSSMARGGKFGLLLRITLDSLARLPPTAQVAVVFFDDFPEVVVPLTEARHRDKIAKALRAQRAGGGTSIYPALEAAHRQLRRSAARLRHVILLSDGQSISLFAHHGHIVEAIARDDITVSAIALGDDADREEMKRIAGRGGGRFYAVDTLDQVPAIFSAETERLTESARLELPLRAVPSRLTPLLAGLDFSGAPPLAGMLSGRERPTAEVLLTGSVKQRPLLTRWHYGLGKVTLWSSDVHDQWGGSWTQWPQFADFWGRLAADCRRRGPAAGLRLSWELLGRRLLVSVEVPALGGESPPPRLLLNGPDGRERTLGLERLADRLYRGQLELEQDGAYGLQADWSWRRVEFRTFGSCELRGEEEFAAARRPGRRLVEAVARAGGGRLDPQPAALLADSLAPHPLRRPLWPGLVVTALLLLLGEVLLRRL